MEKVYCKEGLLITGATLLSAEEAEKLPQHLRSYKGWWWLRSPGYYQDVAVLVNTGGSVYYGGSFVINDFGYVRPTLRISALESSNLLYIGDRFEFGGAEFEVVSDRLAFCTGDIGCCAFRRDWKAEDANVYEASDVKQFVEEWFKSAVQNGNMSEHKDRAASIHNEKIRIDFVNLGEGLCGDYNPTDPNDVNLLRFDVYQRKCVFDAWEPVDDASYCTMMPADTSAEILQKALDFLLMRYTNALETSDSVKKLGERLSYISPEMFCMGIGFDEMRTMVRALKTYCSKSDMFEGEVSILSVDADSSILRGMQTNRRINIDVLDKNGTRSTRLLCIDGKIMNADEYREWKQHNKID